VRLTTKGCSIRQFIIDIVMPDPDPASPAFIKERRYRFVCKKWALHGFGALRVQKM